MVDKFKYQNVCSCNDSLAVFYIIPENSEGI